MMDLTSTIAELHIPTLADDGTEVRPGITKEWSVQKNEEDQWANSHHDILFVQTGNSWSGGRNNVWVANHADPDKRERVVWKEITFLNTNGDKVTQRKWISIDDESKVWNSNGNWQSVSLSE